MPQDLFSQSLATRGPASQSPASQDLAIFDRSSPEAAAALSDPLVDARTVLPLRAGDVVLDLETGDRKRTFLAASMVGRTGLVVSIEEDPAALASVRRAAEILAERVGFANVEFLRGRVDDLALDPARLDACLDTHPVRSADDIVQLAREMVRLRREEPLIADRSFDAVITTLDADCASDVERRAIVREIARVLRPDGRVVRCERDASAP